MGLEDEVDNLIAAEIANKEASAQLRQEIANRGSEPPDEKNWLVSVADELQDLLEQFSKFMLDWSIKPLPLVTAQSRGVKGFWGYKEVTTFTPVGYGGWQLHTTGLPSKLHPNFDAFAVTERSELVLALLANRGDLRTDNQADFSRYRDHYLPGLELDNPPFKVTLKHDFRFILGINEMLVLRPGEQGSIGTGQTDRYWHPPGMSLAQDPLAPDSVLFHATYGEDYEYSKTVTVEQALVQEMLKIKKRGSGFLHRLLPDRKRKTGDK